MTTIQAGPATLAAETRSPGAVRLNRAVLTLLGLVLLLVGLATLALGTGLLDPPARRKPVIDDTVRTWFAGHSWVWWLIAAGGLLLAVLSLLWLLVQVRSNRVSQLRIGERTEHGRTTVAAHALTDALTDEIESYRGVARAAAHLSGSAVDPRLTLEVALDGRAEVSDVQREIVTGALVSARSALSVDTLPTRLEFTVPRSAARDVR